MWDKQNNKEVREPMSDMDSVGKLSFVDMEDNNSIIRDIVSNGRLIWNTKGSKNEDNKSKKQIKKTQLNMIKEGSQ